MWGSCFSTSAGIVEKRLGPNLHHWLVDSMKFLHSKEAAGQTGNLCWQVEWTMQTSGDIHQASQSLSQSILLEFHLQVDPRDPETDCHR